MAMISTLLAITVVLLPVALFVYHLGYRRFVNKKFIIDKLKHPTLARLQNHLYLSDTKAREKEYTARHAQIKAERVKVLAELEEQFKPNRESLKKRHYENSRQLYQFQREMDELSGFNAKPEPEPIAQSPRTNSRPAFTRTLKCVGRVRELPSLTSPTLRSENEEAKVLVDYWSFGDTFKDPTYGLSNIWFHTTDGGWIWSGLLDDQSTLGLSQVSAPAPITPLYAQISTGGENPVVISNAGMTTRHLSAGLITSDKLIVGTFEQARPIQRVYCGTCNRCAREFYSNVYKTICHNCYDRR